jgi:transposase
VRLSPGENPQAGGGRVEGEERAERRGGHHLLRREAGYPGDRDDCPDLPPEPGVHATFAREHEYKRYGTVSLLAGIDLVTGKVHALAKDRHRSREFIEFLELLDAAYPAHTAIKLILDNHSAHISKETKAWLAAQPAGRVEFTFTPKHGSWLNLVEGFFSKLARSVLRHIRVTSKQELKDRIMAAMDHFNQDPVVHTWSYKLDQAA